MLLHNTKNPRKVLLLHNILFTRLSYKAVAQLLILGHSRNDLNSRYSGNFCKIYYTCHPLKGEGLTSNFLCGGGVAILWKNPLQINLMYVSLKNEEVNDLAHDKCNI
jgi:hypothetical protein